MPRGSSVVASLDKKRRILLAVTAALLPCMFFFFLVNQNQEYLPLVPCLLVGGAFALLGFLAYAVLAWIFRTRLVLFTVLVPAWTLFFTWGALYTALAMRTFPGWAKLLLLLSLFAGAHIVLSLLLRRLKSQTPLTFVSLIVVFVFAFNCTSVVVKGIAIEKNRQAIYSGELAELGIKTDFFVDKSAAHPNVYWFHTDGRMSMKNVEKYFGDAQEALAADLNGRGFVLNTDACLVAGITRRAIPALMCPGYYDHVWRESVEQQSGLANNQLQSLVEPDPLEDMIARQNNEMLCAFFAAGYEINTIATDGIYFYPMHRYYDVVWHQLPLLKERNIDADRWQYALEHQKEAEMRALVDLLDRATILPRLNLSAVKVIDYPDSPVLAMAHEKQRARLYYYTQHALLDVLQRAASPRVVVVMDLTAHAPFAIDENGNQKPDALTRDINGYLAQQRFADQLLLEMIDAVLESDPDAVIILQADHGVHTGDMIVDMGNKGFTDEQIIEVQHGVFSAVRIPSPYGSIPEELLPLDPRNIARLLVNRFVGENYQYIQ